MKNILTILLFGFSMFSFSNDYNVEKENAIRIYNDEDAKESDLASAIVIFEKHAHEDDNMLFYLGKANYEGRTNLVSTKKPLGRQYIEKAAVRGHPQAEYEYAMILQKNPETRNESLEFIKSSAKKQNPDAQYILGKMYYLGQGLKKNKSAGFNLITASAEANNPDAQYDLAKIYFSQKEQKIQINGVKWLERSVENKNYKACDELYKLYLTGILVKASANKHLNYLNCSAANKNEDAMFLLGTYYAKGKYVKKNPHSAAYWFKLLAENGVPEASIQYANYAFNFKKKDKDELSTAISYLESIHEQSVDASTTLGYIYKKGGYGKSQDLSKSLKFFEVAKDLGNENAQNEILKILQQQ